LNEIGREANCKLAILDRLCRATTDKQFTYELSSLKTSAEIPAGTIEEQLKALETRVPQLRWERESEIIWVENKHVEENNPLRKSVKEVSYNGQLSGLAPVLHSLDERILEYYVFGTRFQEAAGRIPVHVTVDHGTIRSVLSQVLRERMASGVLLRFGSFTELPCDAHPGPAEETPTSYMWQVMTSW
jgi:hypothetical protein